MKNVSLKEKLLEIGLCIDNEYLDKYCELIESNLNTKYEKFKTQKHHIVPRSYYKHNKIDIDNSKNNIINISHKNHLLAHFYLLHCSKNRWFKESCINALVKMFRDWHNEHSSNYWKDCDDEFIKSIVNYDSLVEESCRLRSEKYKGSIIINNGVRDKFVLSDDDIQYYLDRGWKLGRLYKMSDETKEKLRRINLGKHHTTSEETKRKIGEANKIALKGHKLSDEHKKKLSKHASRCTFYNDGKRNIFIDKDKTPPEGFVKGMILTNITKEEWMSKVHKGRTSEDYNTTGGKIAINNTKSTKYIDEKDLQTYLDKGWKRGKLPLGKLNWYNNGIKNTRAYSCPEGYVEGRLLTEEVRYSLGKGSRNRFKKG